MNFVEKCLIDEKSTTIVVNNSLVNDPGLDKLSSTYLHVFEVYWDEDSHNWDNDNIYCSCKIPCPLKVLSPINCYLLQNISELTKPKFIENGV